MNRKLIVVMMVCLAIILTVAIASAQPPGFHSIYAQIERQQRSIDRGIASGKLTHREADIVQDNLNHIRATVDRLRANDGRLDRWERERIQRMLDRNDRMIRRLKHNPIRRIY